MAQRAFAAALAVAALLALFVRPLVALILFGAALAVFANGRGAFGYGMSRAILAFVSAPFLGLIGVATSLLGVVSTEPGGNFLLLPGLLMVGLALVLLVWAVVTLWRIRRRGGFYVDG